MYVIHRQGYITSLDQMEASSTLWMCQFSSGADGVSVVQLRMVKELVYLCMCGLIWLDLHEFGWLLTFLAQFLECDSVFFPVGQEEKLTDSE